MSPLEAALTQLNHALTDFTSFLEEEAVALASQDAESLTALLPRRNEIHRTLASRWLDLAKVAGTDEPKGLSDLKSRLFPGTTPSPAWQTLEELVHVSDRLNRVNGRLMEEQMRRTQVAMQILQHSLASRGVYGADGRVTDFMNLNRRIDSA
jgi:flagellar biosynthesis/type III secretory pathway chaperone